MGLVQREGELQSFVADNRDKLVRVTNVTETILNKTIASNDVDQFKCSGKKFVTNVSSVMIGALVTNVTNNKKIKKN